MLQQFIRDDDLQAEYQFEGSIHQKPLPMVSGNQWASTFGHFLEESLGGGKASLASEGTASFQGVGYICSMHL